MKLVRRFLILLVILAVLIALAPTLMSGWVKSTAETSLSESLGTEVTISELDIGWFSGARVTDLRIARSDTHPTAVHVRSIDARPEIGALLGGDLIVPQVVVDGVEIRHAAPAGAAGTDGGGSEEGGEAPATGGAPAKVADLPEIDISAEARNVTIIYETAEGDAELRSIGRATVRVKSGEPVTFATGFKGLNVEGTVDLFDGRRMRETVSARVRIAAQDFDLGALADAVRPWMNRLAGTLTIDETIDWSGGDVAARGSVSVKNLVTGAEARAPGELDLKHDVDYAPSRRSLEVTDLDLRASFGTVTAKGSVSLDETAKDGKDLAFDGDVDLAGLTDFLGDLVPMKLAGRCTAKGTARPSGDTTHAHVDLAVDDLRATDGEGETTRLGRVTVAGAASWNATTRTLVIEPSEARSSAALAKLSGTLLIPKDGETSGPLEIDVDGNLDELGVFADALAEMEVGGRVSAKGDVVLGAGRSVDLVLSGTGVTASGLGEGGALGPIDFTGRAVGETTGGALEFSALLLKTDGVEFDGAGTRVVGEDTTIPVRAKLDFGRMGRLSRPFQPDLVISGQSTLNGEVDIAGGRVSGNLKASIRKLTANGGPLAERTLGADSGDVEVSFSRTDAGTAIESLVAKLSGAVTATGTETVRGDVDANVKYAPSGAFDVDAVARNAVLQRRGEAPRRIPSELRILAAGTNAETGRTVDSLRIEGDGIRIDGNADLVTDGIAKVKADGDFDLGKLDAGWLPLLLEGAEGSGKGSLAVDMSLPRGTSGAKGNGRAVVRLDHLRYEGADMHEAVLIVDMTDGVATITRGKSKLNGGDLRLSGTIDTNPEQPVFDVAMDAKGVALVKEWQPAVARVIPLFSGLGATVKTFLSTDVSLKGAGSTWDEMKPGLDGAGSLDCDAGSIKSPLMSTLLSVTGGGPDLAFDGIKTRFEIRDGAVHQDSMYIDGTIVEVRMGGVTGLDGRLDYELGIKPKGNSSREFAKYASILDPEGFLPLGLGGSIDDPSLKMPDPAKLIGGAIKGAAKGALDGLLGGKKNDDKKKNPLDKLGGLLGGKKNN